MFRYTAPEYDTSPHDADSPPARPYVVCATPRSGSTLLCDGLIGAGAAGTPMEYFNPDHRPVLERRWGCDGSLDAFIRALHGRRTTATGHFGVKLHWDQLVAVRAEILGDDPSEPEFGVHAGFLDRIAPGARYVRAVRQDVNRQAVSYWTAYATGIWTGGDEDGRAPAESAPYSFEGIERCRRMIENFELHWDRFMRANAIEPLTVVYEDLVADWEGTIATVVRHLAPEAGAPEVGPPRTRRLADARSDEMLERFARDRRRMPLPDPVELLPDPPRVVSGRYRP